MAFKIQTSRKFDRLLNTKSKDSLIPKVRAEFRKKGPRKVKQAIMRDIVRGISPVKGGGKWRKYSASYKQTIKGEAFLDENGEWVIFRHVGGKVRKIEVDSKKLGRNKFQEEASPTKRITPVNLRHTGGLHRKFRVFMKRKALIVQFNHFLANIHNKLGAGKSKVIRRLLPTEKGESFNRRIDGVIFGELKKAVDKVAKQFSGQ